jgi:hypothetical protein
MITDGKNIEIGTPFLPAEAVEARVLAEPKSKKIRVARFRAKSRHRRVHGHRQVNSVVEIVRIGDEDKKAVQTTTPAKIKKTPVKKTKAKVTKKGK